MPAIIHIAFIVLLINMVSGDIPPTNGSCNLLTIGGLTVTGFACRNGRCIQPSFKCDGDDDCRDNSDEADCDNCDDNQYFCRGLREHLFLSGLTSRCIPRDLRCNGIVDCLDASDEFNCTCNDDEHFRCNNNLCVTLKFRCDGDDDCGDFSDEFNCTSCAETTVRCDNGKCIRHQHRCDGVDNCGDNSDELNCTSCYRNSMICDDGKCIHRTAVCDGIKDCPSGRDEVFCPCTSGQFKCGVVDEGRGRLGRRCIAMGQRCDNVSQCLDGSDEVDCPTSVKQFACFNGQNVGAVKLCDGVDDCGDNSDELYCLSRKPVAGELTVESNRTMDQTKNRTDDSEEQYSKIFRSKYEVFIVAGVAAVCVFFIVTLVVYVLKLKTKIRRITAEKDPQSSGNVTGYLRLSRPASHNERYVQLSDINAVDSDNVYCN